MERRTHTTINAASALEARPATVVGSSFRLDRGSESGLPIHLAGGALLTPVRPVPSGPSPAAFSGTMKAPASALRFGGGGSGLGRALLGNDARPGRRRSGIRVAMGMAASEATDREPCALRGMGTPRCLPHPGLVTSVTLGIARGSDA